MYGMTIEDRVTTEGPMDINKLTLNVSRRASKEP